ncbi:hypothetical protein FRC04_001771 [Tulasnella sp. 424]|nr:hypothetical protein FRC04_001771 [Tulasnella sp. 424]
MLPSIRSFRSRFPFGSKSGSHKKEQRSVSTAVDIIVGEEDVLEIGSSGQADRSLDPAALRPSSPTKPASPGLLSPNLQDSALPRMHSQPNLGNKKRKSFDLAALSARPTVLPIGVAKVPPADLGIGLGRPPFVSSRLNGGRAFTPNGTAIREVLLEGEVDDGEVIDVRAKTPVERKANAPAPKAQTYYPESSNASNPTLPDLDTTPRRSSSMDSNRDSADITRVIDLSFTGAGTSPAVGPSSPTSPTTQYSPNNQSMQPKSPSSERDMQSLLMALETSSDSKRAEQGHPTPVLASGGDAQWTLNDMKGSVTRMKTIVNDGRSSPSSSVSPSSTNPSIRLSILQSSSEPNLLRSGARPTSYSSQSHAPSPLATEFVVPSSSSPKSKARQAGLPDVQLDLLSPETIGHETSFTSYHIDVEAMEAALENKLGKEFVGGLLEDDESVMEPSRRTVPTIVERSFSAPAAMGSLSVIADVEHDESKMSISLGSLDPGLAALLSPNNLLPSSSSTTPTKATPKARQPLTLTLNSATSPRFRNISTEDVTLSADGGRSRSGSLATSATTPALSVGHSPLSAPGVITPASTGPGSASGSSIRSRTPTPQYENDDPMLLTPTKRHSVSSTRTTSTASGATSLVNPSPVYSASSVATSRASRKALPLLPVVIPDPLPPRKISPEEATFSQHRRMTVTSNGSGPSSLPPSPGPRKRTISVETRSPSKVLAASTNLGARRFGPSARRVLEEGISPSRAMSPTLGRTRTSLDHYSHTGRASVDLEHRDGGAYQRPSTSIAHHRRLRTDSPERGARASPQAGREQMDQHPTLPPRANTSFSFNRNLTANARRDQGLSPRDMNAAPMHHLRKRRSYSFDVSGDRSRILAALGQKGQRDEDDVEDEFGQPRYGSRSAFGPVSAASSTSNLAARLDSMGPLTKRAFAAAGLLGGEPNPAGGSSSRLGVSTSKSYGAGDWKDSRQYAQTPDDTMRPTLSRASTLADMVPPTSRHQSKDSVSTAEHPSTPSSTSGPSRTLYAPSTTSSGPGNSAGGRTSPSPVHGTGYLPTITVSSHTETVTMLKERHEVEKEALVSALAEMKRENQRVTKERDDLAAYVSELEERLARAEELNRKMEGLRMAVMEVAGGIGGGDSTGMRSSMRRIPGVSPARTALGTRPGQRPRADSDQLRASQLSRRPPPSESGHLYPMTPSLGRPQRDMHRRSATSEVSSLMPSIPNPRDMTMLFHEHPPSHYAASSIAESEDSRPSSPALRAHMSLGQQSASPSAPSFSFYHADDATSSSGGSLKLRLEDELHLADLVSMGPASDDESESIF